MASRIIVADVLDGLAQLADASVHCVVTSPPYWALRDYGTGTWEGGNDPECVHADRVNARTESSTLGGGKKTVHHQREGFRALCPRCGACRIDRQLGMEATPDEYVEAMVAVFREVRRVLRPDGTLWLNIGDSYTSGGRDRRDSGRSGMNGGGRIAGLTEKGTRPDTPVGLKAKDMVGIPWRLALALQADGWYLRSDIIWHKPNPLPESVTDRPTKSHEHVFLLTASPRYFYDADAVREHTTRHGQQGVMDAMRSLRDVWSIPTEPFAQAHFATFPKALVAPCIKAGTSERGACICGQPWHRQVEVAYENPGNRTTNGPRSMDRRYLPDGTAGYAVRRERVGMHVGWDLDCDDDAGLDPVPCVVLDPFCGSGTTGVVAAKLGRDFIGIELNAEYAEMARRRIEREGRLAEAAPLRLPDGASQLGLFA